jgi:sec-independent protein translocase protein TatA
MRLGTGEILIILVIALLVFGPNKIPQLGDALGRGIRNFKKATNEVDAPAEPTTQVSAALPAAKPAMPFHQNQAERSKETEVVRA